MNTVNESKLFHDLRSPLNSILGFNQLLQISGLKDGVDLAKSQHITTTGNKLLTLIDEIRNQLQVVRYPDVISSHLQRLGYTYKMLNVLVMSFSDVNLDQEQVENLSEIRTSIEELGRRISSFKQTVMT